MGSPPDDVTQLLLEWCGGDQEALERLVPLVYAELHLQAERAMSRERSDHTLQPTALVHETFLKLVDQRRIRWRNRAQFFGVAAQLMRRIVLKYARSRRAMKRGGEVVRVPLDDGAVAGAGAGALDQDQATELIALDEALERLSAVDPRQSRLVELRYFGGLTVEETADVMGLSTATVKRDLRFARAWLQRDLGRADPPR